MAAVIDANNAERYYRWYDPDRTEINPDIRHLIEHYSTVDADKVVDHVNDIRSRGFQSNPYPCIGQYRFLNLTLLTHPLYADILKTLRSSPDALFLDIGCCFGQDMRQLVHDGIPSEQLIGLDIEAPLMELGYDLFLDRDTLKSKFLVVDVFAGANQGEVWTRLAETGADIVHCSAFFHLFAIEDQYALAENLTQLMKVGSVMVGRQSGSVTPGEVPAIKAGTTSFRHDVETWKGFWEKVGENTGTKWEVDGSLDTVGLTGVKKDTVEDQNSRRLLFTVKRVA